MNGWVLCQGDGVLIISPGEDYHGLFAKVDSFPTTLELSSYVQIDGRPTAVGRVLVPNAQLRWMGPGLEQVDQLRPTRPGQRVRVVLDNESLATPEMKSLDGQLGEVMALSWANDDKYAMVTVHFDALELAQWPTNIHSYDLLIVPTPVVQYVPEPVPVEQEPDLPMLGEASAPVAPPAPKPSTFEALQDGVVSYKAGLRVLPLASIVVTRNTRKVFDEAALAELASSITAHGVLQPIVVRPYAADGVPGSHQYELVAGGRRYQAATLAGLAEIPATVRTLTDREFLEVQLLENLQRVDVRPADEAQAFAELLKNGYSAEEIGLKVGKGEKFVLQRAKLAELTPFWLDLLAAERLPLAAAHELARLPADGQRLVAKAIGDSYEYRQGKVLEARSVTSYIGTHVLRQLDKAPWDTADATLYPEAGPCTTCPKRSSACRNLFDDLLQPGKPDTCLDASCYATKKTLYVQRRVIEVKGTGVPLLSSSSYDRAPTGVLGYKYWDSAKESDKGAVQGLLTEGSDAGQLKWVKLTKSAEVAAELETQRKATRATEIRAGKINEAHRGLLAGHLYARATTLGQVLEQHVDNELHGQLRSQGGPHTALRLVLVANFGWEMPAGGEKALRKLTPQSQGEALWAWVDQNLKRLGYTEKLALYFALLGYNCSTFDSSNKRLMGYAKQGGANITELMKLAIESVDGTKAGKKQEASA